MEKHFVINLGRQLGSGGKEIGGSLALIIIGLVSYIQLNKRITD